MGRDRALTGAQKAAVFILHMGKERSAEVLRHPALGVVCGRLALRARAYFAEAAQAMAAGGLERARSLLEESLGGDKATEILDRVTASLIELPFEFLRRADPRQVLSFIQDEHPQTIALVLAYMTPDQAAMTRAR